MWRSAGERADDARLSSSSPRTASCMSGGMVRRGRSCGAPLSKLPTQSSCKTLLDMEVFSEYGGAHPMFLFGLSRASLPPQLFCTSGLGEPSRPAEHLERTSTIYAEAETMSDETLAVSEPAGISGRAPPFRALDPELPSLAAKAAFQLDNLRLEAQGKIQDEPKQDAIAKFALRLQSVVRPGPGVDKRSLLDPLTSSVLHGAVLQATQDKPNNVDDMLVQIGRLTEQLLMIEGFKGQVDMVTALRDFCLAISDLATSKQYLVRAPRPYHGPKSSRL
jgi:hypothetical protein